MLVTSTFSKSHLGLYSSHRFNFMIYWVIMFKLNFLLPGILIHLQFIVWFYFQFQLVLLQHGADPNIRNTDGKTALDVAEASAKLVLTGRISPKTFLGKFLYLPIKDYKTRYMQYLALSVNLDLSVKHDYMK